MPTYDASSSHALLRERDYVAFLGARTAGVLATVTQSVTMGWQVYDLARASHGVAESALYIGLLGLATFVPLFCLALPAGVVADRLSRRTVLIGCFLAEAVCAGSLMVAGVLDALSVPVLIGIAFAFGVARAFRAPGGVALAPMLVPPALLRRAIAWNSLAFEVGSISGPERHSPAAYPSACTCRP